MSNDAPYSAEEARLAEIAELRLTDPDASAVLSPFAERAARELGLPQGMVTIVLDQAQVFVGQHGLTGWVGEVGGTPIEWSFCAQAVRSQQPFVVADATQNPLLAEMPLVTEDGARSYAGVPLVTSRGHAVGTVCVLGNFPREFTTEELDRLREIAGDALQAIEARR